MFEGSAELFVIIVCSLLLLPIALFTSGWLRITLSLVCVLFSPGYTLISALFPAKGRLEGTERLALSFGLSLAIVPLIGLILNFLPWGIRFVPILFSLFGFIIIMSAIALYRKSRLLPEERFDVDFRARLAGVGSKWSAQGPWDKLLVVLLVGAVVVTVGTVVYAVSTPRAAEKFTEFYILGPGGKAQDYPREVILGLSTNVTVGVINHEMQTVNYHIDVDIDGQNVVRIGNLTLQQEQKWEQLVSFNATKAGDNQSVQFQLFRDDNQTAPYRTLQLWLDVKER